MQASSQNQEHSVNVNDEVNCKEYFLCSFDRGLGYIIVAMIDQHGEVVILVSTGCTEHAGEATGVPAGDTASDQIDFSGSCNILSFPRSQGRNAKASATQSR